MSYSSTLRRSVPVLVLALAAVLMPAAGALGQATVPTMLLDDLSQHPSVEPATFEVTNDVALEGLRWSGWGAPTATGTGTLTINTCVPNCAQGRIRVLPGARLLVQGVRTDQGHRYYRQYRITDRAFLPPDRAAYSVWTDAYAPSDFR